MQPVTGCAICPHWTVHNSTKKVDCHLTPRPQGTYSKPCEQSLTMFHETRPFLQRIIIGKFQSQVLRTNMCDMGVSNNRGTPKSSILIGFSIINHPFWGVSPYFWKHPSGWMAFCFSHANSTAIFNRAGKVYKGANHLPVGVPSLHPKGWKPLTPCNGTFFCTQTGRSRYVLFLVVLSYHE